MRESISAEMLSTDRALDLTREGIPFRDAYRTAAANSQSLNDEEIAESLANRTSPGGCGRLETDLLQSRLDQLKN